MSRFSLTHRDVLELVDAFVLKKQYSSTSPPFDTRRVHSLRILADSISAIHPDAKAVVKSTVQSWVLKREKMKNDQSVSEDYWLNLEAELVRKWPRTTPLHVSSTQQPGSPADIPSPLLNPQVTSEPPQCGTRITQPVTEDLDADITPSQEPNRSCYGPSLGLPVPQMTSKAALSGTPIPVYHYGYTDKCGDKSLCYHYDDADSTRVKVWHQNRSDKKETTGVVYYVCSSANCGARAQVNSAGLYVSWAKPHAPECRGEDRREFDCQQCLRYAKLLIRRGVSKMDAHGIAQDRAIALKCYDGLFPPYASMSKTYSKVEATRAISEPEVLKTGEQWLRMSEGGIRVYSTDLMLQTLANCEIAVVDGTFSKCPKDFYQVLTINGLITSANGGAEYQPLVMALLPNKLEKTYMEVVLTIKEAWAKLNITSHIKRMHVDYEPALQKAMKVLVGDDQVYGCLFHYSQALLKTAHGFGLYHHYHSPDHALFQPEYQPIREWIRALMALPCLPKAHAQWLWFHVLSKPPTAPPNSDVSWPTVELQKLADYMESQWISLTDNTWTFWNLGRTRNTNSMEAYHNRMPCNDKKPRLVKYLMMNQAFFTDVQNQIKRLAAGCRPKRRALLYVRLENTTSTLEAKFENRMTCVSNEIEALQEVYKFCRQMSYLLHDVRNKSCHTKKSGKSRAVVNHRLIGVIPEVSPISIPSNAGPYEVMFAVSKSLGIPDDADPCIILPDGDVVAPEFRQSQVSFEGDFEPELIDNLDDDDDDLVSDAAIPETTSKVLPHVFHQVCAPHAIPDPQPLVPCIVGADFNTGRPSRYHFRVEAPSDAEILFDGVHPPAVPKPLESYVYSPPSIYQLVDLCYKLKIDFTEQQQLEQPPMVLQKWSSMQTLPVLGDGNCGFRALSMLLCGSQEHHVTVRRVVNEYLAYGNLSTAHLNFSDKDIRTKAEKKIAPTLNAATPEQWFNMDDALGFALLYKVNVIIFEHSQHSWTLYNKNFFNFGNKTCLINAPIFLLSLRDDHYEPIVCVD